MLFVAGMRGLPNIVFLFFPDLTVAAAARTRGWLAASLAVSFPFSIAAIALVVEHNRLHAALLCIALLTYGRRFSRVI